MAMNDIFSTSDIELVPKNIKELLSWLKDNELVIYSKKDGEIYGSKFNGMNTTNKKYFMWTICSAFAGCCRLFGCPLLVGYFMDYEKDDRGEYFKVYVINNENAGISKHK